MEMRSIRSYYWGLGIIILLIVALYLPGIDGHYYSDDFQFVFKPLPQSPLYHFTHINTTNVMAYRPIQAALMVMTQKYWGMSTIPIHGISILVHILMTLLVAVILKNMFFSNRIALLAAAIMAFSQVNVHAIMSNDTLSQSIGALCCLAAYALYARFSAAGNDRDATRRYYCYLASLLFFLAALFSKETEISAVIGISLIAVYMSFFVKYGENSIRGVVLSLIPFILLALFYYWARSSVTQVQAGIGDGRYQFNIGLNIFINISQYFFAAVTPFSTVTVMSAIKTRNVLLAAGIGFCTLLYIFMLVYGFLQNKTQTRKALLFFLLLALAIVNSFPGIALNHISELYVYNSMPFIAALSGIGIGFTLETVSSLIRRRLILAACIGLLGINALSVYDKVHIMRDNGERATQIINSIRPYAESLPEHGRLVLVQPPASSVEYSVFLINGFQILECGLHRIKQVADRDDISIEIIDDIKNIDPGAPAYRNSLLLSLDNDTSTSVFPIRR